MKLNLNQQIGQIKRN